MLNHTGLLDREIILSKEVVSKVAGVTQADPRIDRQKLIREALRVGDTLILERDPSNLYDKNAIEVYTQPGIAPWKLPARLI
jgi:hypothetical protein